MAKFDSVESVKAKYEAGERVFTSHEVMVLLTYISKLEHAAQQSVQRTAIAQEDDAEYQEGEWVGDEGAR